MCVSVSTSKCTVVSVFHFAEMDNQQRNEDVSRLEAAVQEIVAATKETEWGPFLEIIDDDFLEQFVRVKKYDAKVANASLHNYLHRRIHTYPHVYLIDDPRSFGIGNDIGAIRFLSRTDQHNRKIIVVRAGNWDPNAINITTGLNQLLFFFDEAIRAFPCVSKEGIVIILDLKKVGYKQISQVTPSVLYMGVRLFVDSIPVKYKAMHVINLNVFMLALFTTFKLLLPKKLRDRVHTHGSVDSVHETITPTILPEMYGGPYSEADAYDDEFEQRLKARSPYYERFKSLAEKVRGGSVF